MSHYTVAVITKDGDYEKALEPFNESLEVEPYIAKTKGEIVEEIQKRKEEHDKMVHDGEPDTWFDEHYGNVNWNDEESIYEAFTKVEDWNKYDEEGNVLSSYNPDSKWDWYQLGGRWCGSLKLKEHATATVESHPSLFGGSEVKEGYTDYAQIKDIDFTPDEKKVTWAKRFWEINIEGKKLLPSEKKEDYTSFYNEKYYIDKYGTKEEFVRSSSEFMTYAILYNGEWIEPGQMGWFGCSSADSDGYEEYRRRFREIISNLSPDDYIAVVDCHI